MCFLVADLASIVYQRTAQATAASRGQCRRPNRAFWCIIIRNKDNNPEPNGSCWGQQMLQNISSCWLSPKLQKVTVSVWLLIIGRYSNLRPHKAEFRKRPATSGSETHNTQVRQALGGPQALSAI